MIFRVPVTAYQNVRRENSKKDIPQADDVKVFEGYDTAEKIKRPFGFVNRQSSYYRQASEILGLVSKDRGAKINFLIMDTQEYSLSYLSEDCVISFFEFTSYIFSQHILHFAPKIANGAPEITILDTQCCLLQLWMIIVHGNGAFIKFTKRKSTGSLIRF